MTDAPPPTRRKRVRLAQAVGTLKQQVRLYRSLFAAATVIVGALALFLAIGPSTAEPVPLGTGQAGVAVAQPERAMTEPGTQAGTEGETGALLSAEHLGDGQASFYGDALAGNPTASGEVFDPSKMTAAHRTLPLGSRVRVTNLRNGEAVIVRINDRGPFHGQRVIDLSKGAARKIGMLRRGTARVRLELLAAN